MIVLRTAGLTLLMQTLVVAALLQELANKWSSVTGGSDGLLGMKIDPIFGLFRFDLFGDTAYVYCLLVLFVGWLIARNIVYSPFGRSLTGIRENANRMHAIGAPVDRRKIVIYTISAALAGLSGALIAQTTALVGLNTLALSKSGELIIMLVIGGVGQLYGAFIGVPLYMIAQDRFSQIDPIFWYFWIGLLLVIIVAFFRKGLLPTGLSFKRRRGRRVAKKVDVVGCTGGRRQRLKFPEKYRARGLVATAILKGSIIPELCFCGAKAQAHHEDYSKPLEVQWLCTTHHNELHVELRRLARLAKAVA
jgi:branched-chain amino acid transport system permease protein